jgi:hypothetical protein
MILVILFKDLEVVFCGFVFLTTLGQTWALAKRENYGENAVAAGSCGKNIDI